MNDLFGPAPVEAQGTPSLPAPSAAGVGAEPYAPGEPRDRTSIAWYAWKQDRLREEGWRTVRERQAAIKRAAQDGINRAVEHAEEVTPGWSDVAFQFVKLHAMRNKGARMTGYEIVQAALQYGVPKPPTDKAFGGPIQRAARSGILKKVGTVADPNPNRHGSEVALWEVV